MGKFYMAAEKEKDGKFFAFVITATSNDNLLSKLAIYKDLAHVNLCKTKKEAFEIAEFWNLCSLQNGTNMYLYGG